MSGMPRFTSRVDGTGAGGNTCAILGCATSYMRQLGVAPDVIKQLRKTVLAADSRAAAIRAVREWFPVDLPKGDPNAE